MHEWDVRAQNRWEVIESGMPVPAVLIDWPNAEMAVLRELSARLAEAAASRQARAVILTEAGRAFCAGADIAGSVERGQC